MTESGVGNELEATESVKDGFLTLCAQYERLGQLLHLQAKIVSHPNFSVSSFQVTFQGLLDQYVEMGEQLKALGTGLEVVMEGG